MMTMDSAARAIDMMLHRGRAEERDGGVWLDDLAADEVSEGVELVMAAGYPELVAELREEIQILASDVKRWKRAHKEASARATEYRSTLVQVRRTLNGKGLMRDKLGMARELVKQ